MASRMLPDNRHERLARSRRGVGTSTETFQLGDARRAPPCPRLPVVFSHRSRGAVAAARRDRLAYGAVFLERHLRCVVGGDARESTALASALEHDACDVGGEP